MWQCPYVAARVGFEPVTLRIQGAELTTELPRPFSVFGLDKRLPREWRDVGLLTVPFFKN